MKTKLFLAVVAAACGLSAIVNSARAQGTAFTYQGQLQDNGAPANGTYNLTFSLYDSAVGGNLLAGPFGTNRVNITNGLFTVLTDFGTGPWNIGSNVWLTIGVETNGGAAFTTLAPRQQVTPTPYAIYTESAGSATSATNFTGVVGGDVTGTQGATVVASVGGQSAASIAQGVAAANAATPSNAPNAIVARDSNGNISANSLTLGGGLNLPFPAILSSGGTNFLMEIGSLYMGFQNSTMATQQANLDNTAFGDYALAFQATHNGGSNSFGAYNTAFGEYALEGNQSGTFNTASGFEALLMNSSGDDNTATGGQALQNNTGSENTATGMGALSANLNGSANTAEGIGALGENIAGSDNTAHGAQALLQLTNGTGNIAVGYGAGLNLKSGNNNIYIGNAGVTGDNGAIRIGNEGTQGTTVIAGIFNGVVPGGEGAIPVYVDSAGHLGPMPSSAQFKRDIQPMGDVSDVLLKLQPVTFKYKESRDPTCTPQFGLVAEEVNQVDPDLVVRDANHQVYSVRYEAVNAMLLNEFLKEHQRFEELKARLDKMEQIIGKH